LTLRLDHIYLAIPDGGEDVPRLLVSDIDALAASLETVNRKTTLPVRKHLFTTDPLENRIEFIEDP